MKRYIVILIAIALAALVSPAHVSAQTVTLEEARTVAANWITMIIHYAGDWGGSQSATVREVEELRRDDRLLGYWFHIEPQGHIVVSLLKGLAPVRAYSATWDGDPSCDEDIVDIVKSGMVIAHAFIEDRIGPVETAIPEAIESIAEFSYRDTWELLNRSPKGFVQELQLNSRLKNYEQYQILLATNWGQSSPYNLFCPEDADCTSPHYDGRCATGCTATAAAQIMKYWCWPPYGTEHPFHDHYGWDLMPDAISGDSPQVQIDAVANLCREVGHACLMSYCGNDDCGSGAFPEDMVDAYEDYFRYNPDLHMRYKDDHGNAEWFELIKEQLNVNRPLQYGITGHSVVVDGYQHVMNIRMYHINYGWGGAVGSESCWDPYRDTGSNTWFTVYNLPCAVDDDMIAGIQPDVFLGAVLGPFYGNNPSFPYRYVDVDATGTDVTFSAGQLIQFLPGIIIRGIGTSGAAIKIFGTPTLHTRLFTRGDLPKGVRIENGGIALYGEGAVKLY